MAILGLDIGGANLKAATSDGRALSVPFPLWKEPVRLLEALQDLMDRFADCQSVAVTMTGELADCFATKAEGVAFITQGVLEAWDGDADQCRFWSTAGRFVSAVEAIAHPLSIAAANWHALATQVGKEFAVNRGLLIDIGTTTTDIVPLENGGPRCRGMTDLSRLGSRELVYSGVRRTPLLAVAAEVPWQGEMIRVAAELFATTLDVFLLTGDLPENPHDIDTANGKPATVTAAYDRIARMLCGDRAEISLEEARALARYWCETQTQTIAEALRTVVSRIAGRVEMLILSGSGAFLAHRAVQHVSDLDAAIVKFLATEWGEGLADSACAAAVARLSAANRPATTSWEI